MWIDGDKYGKDAFIGSNLLVCGWMKPQRCKETEQMANASGIWWDRVYQGRGKESRETKNWDKNHSMNDILAVAHYDTKSHGLFVVHR